MVMENSTKQVKGGKKTFAAISLLMLSAILAFSNASILGSSWILISSGIALLALAAFEAVRWIARANQSDGPIANSTSSSR